ncbi:MAG: YfcE family phosphodiesterase [Candidatus Nanohaloarchaea archaeon]
MIAVVSDSHVPARAESVPERFREILGEADIAVHCGDFETREVYESLKSESDDFYAVKGNCDRFELPASETFQVSDIAFGVYHGTGIHPRGDRSTLAETARKLDAQVLLNGHTHQQEAVRHDGKILLNPGSCTGVGGGSYRGGNPEMMTVEVDEKLEVTLYELEDGELKKEKEKFEV